MTTMKKYGWVDWEDGWIEGYGGLIWEYDI